LVQVLYTVYQNIDNNFYTNFFFSKFRWIFNPIPKRDIQNRICRI
jgi:hypothetical protein